MPGQVIIRAAVVSEHGCLEALQKRASLSNPGDREWLLAHPDVNKLPCHQIEAGNVFVAQQDGTVVGFAAISPRMDGGTDLDALFVEPERWRRGIGRRLVDYCLMMALSMQSSSMHVIGNPHADDFYIHCGFERIGTTKLPFGIGVLFRRDLLVQ